MKKFLPLLIYLIFACVPNVAQETKFPKTSTMTKDLNSWIEKAFDPEKTPGMAVVVVQDGQIVYQKGFGYADRETKQVVTPNTVFYLASSTKSFMGLAVALLEEKDSLVLEDSLAKFLPSELFHSSLSAEKISLYDLLSHTHGISNTGPIVFRSAFTGDFTQEQLIELLQYHRAAKTGKEFSYGNIGYNIASIALNTRLGISWKELVKQEVLLPLSMNETTSYVSEIAQERLAMPYRLASNGLERLSYGKKDENMHAAGGLVSSASDLGLWLIANLEQGKVKGKQVFSKNVIQKVHRPYAKEKESDFFGFAREHYSLGWHSGLYDGDKQVHHFGGFRGFHSHISFMPERGIGVAVLVNESVLGAVVASTVARGIYDRLRQKADLGKRQKSLLQEKDQFFSRISQEIKEGEQRRKNRSQDLLLPLDAYIGTYVNEQLGRMVWYQKENKLQVTMGVASSEVEVFDASKHQLRVELLGSGSVIRFEFPKEEPEKAETLRFLGQEFRRVEEGI